MTTATPGANAAATSFRTSPALATSISPGAVGSVAEAVTGIPAADLRFEAMAPVSADRRRMFARTAELICGQLVTSGAAGIHPLVLQELTRLAAVAFLSTFPNTTPTGYLRRIRLERAHADLGGSDPVSGTTVAAIARRWGWASHSQLTVAYQKRFGVLPSRTLRS
jgi:AraC-like DNA-binding protein